MGLTKQLPDNSSPQSSSNKETGDWGEKVATDYLITLGYAIRELKWRGAHFEIDIVAQKGTRIIFCEVKTRRSNIVDPATAVDQRRRQHMINAADTYLKVLNLPFDYQFDIISIIGTPHDYSLEHIADAFFPTPKTRTRR